MKTRQQHIDFDRNYCEHYKPIGDRGLADDSCALGCGASERMKAAREQNQPGPCIGGHEAADVHALCPKWQRRSLQHAEERADSIEKLFRDMEIAGPVIAAWRKKKPRGKQEVIECPVCKGRLHLSQSSYNGHVRGQCETADCLNWIE
jgi:hypothetical protein